MKVTDLEKFAFENVWRPYWPMHPDAGPRSATGTPERYEDRFGKKRHTLMQTLTMLQENPDYRACVIGRLAAIGVRFPEYVKHPLVDAVREWLRDFDAGKESDR